MAIKRSGVILIDMRYDNKKGRVEPALLLFCQGNVCSDGGGQRDNDDKTDAHTASRELYEESCGLIYISAEHLENCPKFIQKHRKSRSSLYFANINIPEIDTSLFRSNRYALKRQKAPQCWLEKQSIKILYISDVKKALLTEELLLNPTNETSNVQIAKKFQIIVPIMEQYIAQNTIPTLSISPYKNTDNFKDSPFLESIASFALKFPTA